MIYLVYLRSMYELVFSIKLLKRSVILLYILAFILDHHLYYIEIYAGFILVTYGREAFGRLAVI